MSRQTASAPRPPAARPWVVIQHVAWEGPGTIAAEAAARGIALEIRRMDRGDPVPSVEEIGGLVVMGGPMGANDVADHPHLALERRLARDAVARGLPVLGVCLGSQILALALGARVATGPEPEVGVGDVALTDAGRGDPVLGDGRDRVPVVHWHGDTFDLPEGAVLLAESARYRHQAYRVGDRVYGFQFHLELDEELAAGWRPHLPPGVSLEAERIAVVERAGRPVLGRFFDRVLERERASS